MGVVLSILDRHPPPRLIAVFWKLIAFRFTLLTSVWVDLHYRLRMLENPACEIGTRMEIYQEFCTHLQAAVKSHKMKSIPPIPTHTHPFREKERESPSTCASLLFLPPSPPSFSFTSLATPHLSETFFTLAPLPLPFPLLLDLTDVPLQPTPS